MYCKKCGIEIKDLDTKFCPNCGQELNGPILNNTNDNINNNYNDTNKNIKHDDGNVGWLILGLFFPLIGFILYLVWKDERPLSSKKAGKGALIGVIVSLASSLLIFLIALIISGGIIGVGMNGGL